MTETTRIFDPDVPKRLAAEVVAARKVGATFASPRTTDLEELLDRLTVRETDAEQLADKCARYRSERDVYHGQADELAAKLNAALPALSTAQAKLTAPEPDYTRYEPGYLENGQRALWCLDCDTTKPIWTEAEAAHQGPPISLANMLGIAERHEDEHHPRITATAPDADA